MKNYEGKIAVVVTTEHRGVFFGFINEADKKKKTIEVEKCQMCVSWNSSVRGVMGLAANGPNEDCKITPKAPAIILHGVVSVMVCTDRAIKAWEAEPWN